VSTLSQRIKGPWTWDKRAREALLPILGEEVTDKFIEETKTGGGWAHGQTIKVPSGKAEEVAKALYAVHPDEGYSASYSVQAKGDDAVVIHSRPWDMVT